jgi:hypothetical protein
MNVRSVAVAAILVSAVATLPLAYASPPDPSWLPGFWDDADYDEVITMITSAVGAIAHLAPEGGAHCPLVCELRPGEDQLARFARPSSDSTRAPPAA